MMTVSAAVMDLIAALNGVVDENLCRLLEFLASKMPALLIYHLNLMAPTLLIP